MKTYCSECKHYPVVLGGKPIRAFEIGAPLKCYGERLETSAEWLGDGARRITPLLLCITANASNCCQYFEVRE